MEASSRIADKTLIAWCISGNENGYTQLYNRYAKPVFNSVCRLVADIAEAEDILQEVFVSVFSDPGRLKEVENFEAWVKRVAINKSISHLRKRKIYFTDIEESAIADTGEEEMNDSLELECRLEDLRNAIADLPAEARTIVSLFLFENLPQEEIGKMLGLSHNAVRSQYHRAKKKILQTLKHKTYHE